MNFQETLNFQFSHPEFQNNTSNEEDLNVRYYCIESAKISHMKKQGNKIL